MTALPYYNNSKSFERREGQIEITGVQYNYVKQRIYHDSLELVCIPNKAATQLRSAKDDFFKLVNDLQYGQSKKTNSHNNNYKNFSLDHFTLNDFCELQIAILTLAKNRSPYLDDSSFDFSSSDEQPPDTQA